MERQPSREMEPELGSLGSIDARLQLAAIVDSTDDAILSKDYLDSKKQAPQGFSMKELQADLADLK